MEADDSGGGRRRGGGGGGRRKRRRKLRGRDSASGGGRKQKQKQKLLEPEDLPARARWTIIATACLLLLMSILLVGVTLRMAPIIDEMVRKENEEYLSAIGRDDSGLSSAGQNVTSGPPPLLLDNP